MVKPYLMLKISIDLVTYWSTWLDDSLIPALAISSTLSAMGRRHSASTAPSRRSYLVNSDATRLVWLQQLWSRALWSHLIWRTWIASKQTQELPLLLCWVMFGHYCQSVDFLWQRLGFERGDTNNTSVFCFHSSWASNGKARIRKFFSLSVKHFKRFVCAAWCNGHFKEDLMVFVVASTSTVENDDSTEDGYWSDS